MNRWKISAMLFLTISIPQENSTLYAQDLPLLMEKANQYLESGDLVNARTYYEAEARIDGNSAAAYRGIGNVALMRHEWKQALEAFQKSLLLEPSNFETLYGLSLCYNQLHDPDNAKEYLRRIIRRDENYRDVWYQYAIALSHEGRLRKAILFTERQLELTPGEVDVQLGLYRFYRSFVDAEDILKS